MEKDIDQVIKERLQILPPDIKKAINELDWGKTVLPIGKKNGLSIEQMGDLQQQTVFVLIGLLHPNEYFDEIDVVLLPIEVIHAVLFVSGGLFLLLFGPCRPLAS
jgi:hypothetical protein